MLATYLDDLGARGEDYTLAIVFASVEHEVAEIQAAFRGRGITVCGCSTDGEVAGSGLHASSIVGLLLDIPTEAFTPWQAGSSDIFTGAEGLGRRAVESYAEPQVFVLMGGIILADGRMIDGEDVVRGINQGAGRTIAISGGLASDDYNFEGCYVFDNEGLVTLGLSAVIFDASVVKVESCARSGWQAIGSDQVITAAEGNVVHSINDEPALVFFERYLGSMTKSSFDRGNVSVVTSEYPVQIHRPLGTVLRAPAFPHPNGTSIVLAGGVQTGERFRFTCAPGFEVIQETVAFFREQVARQTVRPLAALMMSCKGRHSAFGPMLEDEIEEINEAFGVPMAGFLTYSEIGSCPSEPVAMHNDTLCMITFTAA